MATRVRSEVTRQRFDTSDAGGVAARLGFKYQDHVAAHFVLRAIEDRRIVQVECETADDITLIHHIDGVLFVEYIQVKSTDRDTKWNIKELTDRKNKNTPSSVAERSLISDKTLINARFRIVAQRGVSSSLDALTEPVELRDSDGPIAALASSIKRRHPKTLSENRRDLDYWTRNTVWQVFPGIEHVENRNLRHMSRLAEDFSVSPSHTYIQEMYNRLLGLVDSAAVATRRTPAAKVIKRDFALDWWRSQIEGARSAARKTAKPYLIRGDKFFAEIHTMDHPPARRSSSSYDAQFERKTWRSRQLAKHLSEWLPEVSLKASELVEIDQLHLRQKLEAGLAAINEEFRVDPDRLLGETLLHAVLRHWYGSEPIACKLFNRSRFGDKVTKNAHIIHASTGDQLWLGRIRFFDGDNVTSMTEEVRSELAIGMDTEVLHEERNIILQLREPQHLTSNTLDQALEPGSPIDELIKVLCFPLLIVYDSKILSAGHSETYKEKLLFEVKSFSDAFVASLPPEVDEIQVHLFLVPVEKLSKLRIHFAEHLGST